MRPFITINSIIALTCVGAELVASIAVKAPGNAARDTTPLYPHDPNTTPYCTEWWDIQGLFTCQELVEVYTLSMADFIRWNPTITPQCGNFIESGQSYCVAVDGEPVVTTTVPGTTTVLPTKTTTNARSTSTTSTPTTGPRPTTTIIDGTSYPMPPAPTVLGSTPKCKRCAVAEDYWTLVGCLTDSITARRLANRITLPNEISIMTPKSYSDAYAAAGYRLAGIEYGS
ncbi:hypothetical protein V496_06716 [Pseudogymnoascus sp. VKM F-4515 (FW-2607)]|nr:hypothetical protein V496_06716 [Pseudogymnoascus sp. VKM F-4515 (FW-2607)]KFY77099.1 hypothetical protein V498_09420 [Pseudogymnoascus sp. VKM F-4517 (FW-2822)]